ncbi:tripartite tricarboxylate transporter TctB family protein [Sedimentibacter sp.]|uniref:tripartite tricarboxylate transporter TctB family protein n=1 Tax=Sedimentibacter sp. TaxID=1960295 RepID=UPI0028A67409|nr:tripartite tricarboxylate transporter TctB family protein [Sedimentibacter sp.]
MSIKIVYSTSHTVFPKIILGILILFAVILFIQALMKAKKLKCPVFNFKSKKFFIENYDKMKFYGTIILLALYVICMNLLRFIPASIIFISLFNILYAGKKDIKTIAICIGIAAIETLLVWFIFGYVFDITLP